MDELRECINCNYQKGFNIFFKRTKGKIKICLVCSNCGQSYDLDWITTNIKDFKTEKGLMF
ncbi:MAG: hypothetical protein LLF28_02845 [Nitrospiraceae bacterium]|nr:hypothetical protein [Nitrospiraceae bacterium]